MSAVYALTTSLIKKNVLRNAGEVDDGTSFYDTSGQVLDQINRAYVAILSGGNEFDVELSKPWTWAVEPSPGIFVMKPQVDTTIGVVNGSNQISFVTAPTISLKGYWFSIAGRPEFFRVTQHLANQVSATIDSVYTDTTASSVGATFILIDYTLSPPNGILRLVHPFVIHKAQYPLNDFEDKVYYGDQQEMTKDYPLRMIRARVPTMFCITNHDPVTGAVSIRFNSYMEQTTRVEYEYIKVPDLLTDGMNGTIDSPVRMPIAYRDALEYAATYFLCLDKNDNRAQQYLGLTTAKLKAMLKHEEKQKTQTSNLRGRLIPRGDQFWRDRKYVVQEVT